MEFPDRIIRNITFNRNFSKNKICIYIFYYTFLFLYSWLDKLIFLFLQMCILCFGQMVTNKVHKAGEIKIGKFL